MSQAHRRDFLQTEQLCGLDPAMTGNDLAVLSDENGVSEAELPDAIGDLSDLFLGVGSGIAGIGPEARERNIVRWLWIGVVSRTQVEKPFVICLRRH
jgi:hypothetical protein